jgi:hypothetical protein
MPALEAAWQAEERATAARAPAPAGLDTLRLALWQAGDNKAARLRAAAVPYGRVASPLAGLYYLGEAHAHVRWRDFVAGSSIPAASANAPGGDEAAFDPGALGSELAALEDATVAAFARDPTAPTMVPVSARLKEARELFESGALAGAALATLEARLVLSRRLEAPAPGMSAAGTASPPADAGTAGGSSLRALFAAVAAEDADPATAALVARDVLPLHDRLGRNP